MRYRYGRLLVVLFLGLLGMACVSNEQRTEWALLAAENHELELVVAVGGTCDSLTGIEVTETETEVAIAAIVRHQRLIGEGCATPMFTENVEVDLEAPLGSRELTGCLIGHEFRRRDGSLRESCSEIFEW